VWPRKKPIADVFLPKVYSYKVRVDVVLVTLNVYKRCNSLFLVRHRKL
jgi:hypothetical protein